MNAMDKPRFSLTKISTPGYLAGKPLTGNESRFSESAGYPDRIPYTRNGYPPCTTVAPGYTEILSETCAAPRIRQRGFFTPVMGEIRLSFPMGDEEQEIANTCPGVTSAESESPAPQTGRFPLKLVEATHGH